MGSPANDAKRIQARFESPALKPGLEFVRYECGFREYRYDFTVEVVGTQEIRKIQVYWSPSRPADPITRMPGVACRRHRNQSADPIRDLSLCLWYPSDSPGDQWTLDGRLRQLRDLAATHAFCESRCRLREPWHKREAPRPHPRPQGCRGCPENGRSCP
jgi:hypothetical protein